MLNWIWLGMILIAVMVGGFTGRIEQMTDGAFTQAKDAVMTTALPLIGMYTLWLGMMRLAERAGLVQALARALRPVMRWLFPGVPAEHPAMGSMVMNIAANMLGLGNAATPFGLKAMAHLQKLNPNPSVASNAMVTFLTINTASVQLLPTTAMAYLVSFGSHRTSFIVGPAFIASAFGLGAAIFLSRFLAKWRAFRLPETPEAAPESAEAEKEEPDEPSAEPTPLTVWGKLTLVGYFALFGAMFCLLVWPEMVNSWLVAARQSLPTWFSGTWFFGNPWPDFGPGQRIVRALSLLAVPGLLSFFPLYASLRGVKVYEEFCDGAKEAFDVVKKVIPFLVGMLISIRLLRDSGALGAFTEMMRPVLAAIHFPPELLPLAVMRSLSGSASSGIFLDLINPRNFNPALSLDDARNLGPDSLTGLTAATMYGSSETTFYVIAVYFGSVGIRKTRHAVVAGLGADLVAVIGSIIVCRWLF